MSIYAIKILSTFIHLILIFSISSISVASLGRYSFFIALASIISQICMFEELSMLLQKVKLKEFYEFYFSNIILWGIFIVLTFYLVKDDVLASIFVSIFILNLTSEKLINIFTINERLNKDDSTYIKFHNLKNIFMEIIVPSIFIFNIQNFQKWSNFPTLFLIICLFVIVLITIYAYKQEAKPKFMRISFFSE